MKKCNEIEMYCEKNTRKVVRAITQDKEKMNVKKHELLECAVCGNEFEEFVHLLEHVCVHTDNKPFTCNLCQKTFTRSDRLQLHLKLHQTSVKQTLAPVANTCATCGRQFKLPHMLKRHMVTHTKERNCMCSICGIRLCRSDHLAKHIMIHDDVREKNFKCTGCGSKFLSADTLKKHMVVHTPGFNPNTCGCDTCGKMFRNSAIKNHMRSHMGQKPHKCSVCQKSFTQKGALSNHMRIHTGEKPHGCKICLKAFGSGSELWLHMNVHDKIKVPCQICKKNLSSKRALSEHMERHSDKTPHRCDICEAKFKTLRDLKSHKHCIHSNMKKFECELCGMKYKSHTGLQHHRYTHNRDIIFKCSICGQDFYNLMTKIKHERKERKKLAGTLVVYSCDICSKTFTISSVFEAHKLTKHTSVRPYVCSICGLTFRIAKTLRMHSIDHLPYQPYKCWDCGKEFKQKSGMRVHIQTHHAFLLK